MLWTPSTYGEQLFLELHRALGAGLSIAGGGGRELDYLVNAERFTEFVQLAATTEIFYRAVRECSVLDREVPHADPLTYATRLFRVLNLPAELKVRHFGEVCKQVGGIVNSMHRGGDAGARVGARNQCYLCGHYFGQHHKRSVEHIWPLALGGSTQEQNLIPACESCNTARGSMLTWIGGPVQGTFDEISGQGHNPDLKVRISLGLARLVHYARSSGNRKPKTLKQAAEHCFALWRRPPLPLRKKLVYFEYLKLCEEHTYG